jgi:hypothetical protein
MSRMERLPFVLPDFTRYMWASDAARDTWAPRLQRITEKWFEIEWMAVEAGVRACAVTVVGSERLAEATAAWLDRGLATLPLEIQGVGGVYASTAVQPTLGQPFVYRVVVGRPADLRAFRTAWRTGDDAGIGRLLGYPPCCTDFFRRVWVKDAMVDTTWPMAMATAGATNGERELTVAGPPEGNILWRWMGARAVPHLPCRFDCEATVGLGRRLMEIGREGGHTKAMNWLLEVLRWPVEWSALHGIAEVKTPVLKVSTRTDATAVKYVVRREGDAYPTEGARGLMFPYRVPGRRRVTESRAFRRGLDQVVPDAFTRPDWYATDNGFPSVLMMERAHAPIVALAAATLGAAGGAVLDLGCGNGALLARLRGAWPTIDPYGVDSQPDRIARVQEVLPGFASHFWVEDLFDGSAPWREDRRYVLALLMPGRLLETDAPRAARLRERLRTHCERVLVYAYGDWLSRYGGLDRLAAAAGLRMGRMEGPVGLAEIP